MEYRHKGKLIFKYGPMNSAKTVNLLTKAFELEARNQNVFCLRPSVDDRETKSIIRSRISGIEPRECLLIAPEANIIKICEDIINCIGNTKRIWFLVDEAQFLSSYQIEGLASIVDTYNVTIVCYGLRTDFKTKLFPGSLRLFELADDISEIKSTCECGNDNIVNARIDKNGNLILEGEQVETGTEDKYITLCRSCYNKMKNKNKTI